MPTPLETGRAIVEEVLSTNADLDVYNRMLTEAGRPNLVISEQATVLQISSPEEVITKLNNFRHAFNFQKYTDVPVTEESLARLRTQPDYLSEQFEGNDVGVAQTHAGKPAFQRMLTLYPDFTIQLVLAVGQTSGSKSMGTLTPDLFTAYQLISQLVDEQDPYVIRDGKVDDYYFYR